MEFDMTALKKRVANLERGEISSSAPENPIPLN